MNVACSKAFEATGKERYRQLAITNMEFLLQHFPSADKDQFHHTWKNGTSKNFGFLDDYAFLIQALLHLQQVTGSTAWLFRAKTIAGYVIKNFSEDETGFFFFTNSGQEDVVIRKKEVYDGATPSGNAIMVYALYHLSIFFDLAEWRQRTEKVIRLLGSVIIRHPASFGVWAGLLLEMVAGTQEIAIMGEDSSKLIKELLAEYIPHKILIASAREDETLPLLAGKKAGAQPLIYLCKQYSCLEPVTEVSQLLKLIKYQE
jgi:uncharacterized protein YyaL (SSP411 family)